MKTNKTQNGITLVALIITIIVLLILAVVAIRAVQGDGIIAHAKNARSEYQGAAEEENRTIQNYADYISGQVGDSAGGSGSPATPITAEKLNKVLSTTENTKLLDKYGNPITVPAGFKIVVDNTSAASKSTSYTADTIDVTKGIVIEDEAENQFVWVPVGKIYTDEAKTDTNAKTVTLGRYSWSGSTGTLVQPIKNAEGTDWATGKGPTDEVAIKYGNYNYGELQPTANGKGPNRNAIARNINDFYNSSTTNGGYYIGRYEAGDSSASASTARTGTNGTSTPGTLVCKANQEVYNYILQSDASAKSQAMYTDGFSSGTFSSDLVNSYAWDTAIMFIQTFGTETDANSYASLNKSTSFAKTGVNPDKYCNIYDLSGNAYEWTTETFSIPSGPCAKRGGCYNTSSGYAYSFTSFRSNNSTTGSKSDYAFRPLIYVALNA